MCVNIYLREESVLSYIVRKLTEKLKKHYKDKIIIQNQDNYSVQLSKVATFSDILL